MIMSIVRFYPEARDSTEILASLLQLSTDFHKQIIEDQHII